MRAAIVIPAWNCWEQTAACLGGLAELGPGHLVVVVDNGSTDETAAGLATLEAVHVITNATNRGFGPASNQGANWALSLPDPPDVIVFLNNDTVPLGGWLDELLEVFSDPRVGAAGPRSNFVSGPQLVEAVGYRVAGSREHRAFETTWRQARTGQHRSVRRLVGFALAVRADALRQVGLFDEAFGIGGYEDDDLGDRLLHAGWDLVVADGSFVHHDGHVTFDTNGLDWRVVQGANAATIAERRRTRLAGRPLLSACLIVKNEEANLVDCLRGLNRVVDEVVVYDTGSTDGTVALARRYGASVEEGYWDDDFARARNAALARCSGTWILHVDGDEVLQAEPRLLRGVLESDPPVDAITVEIYNLLGDGTQPGYTHRGVRLFRRERCSWRGRLHEQVMLRPGFGGELAVVPLVGARIVHSGYTDEALTGADKLARNLRVARAASESRPDEDDEPGLIELNLARSLAAIGRVDEAMTWYERADALVPSAPARRMARMHAAEAALAVGDADLAERWVDALREVTACTGIPDVLASQIAHQRGDATGALALLESVTDTANEDGYSLPAGSVEARMGAALLLAGRTDEAADVLLALLETTSDVVTVTAVTDTLLRAGRSFEELACVLPETALLRASAALVLLDVRCADRVAEALVARFGVRPEILAASVRFGPGLPLERALVWSSRLRRAGAGDNCPVLARASGHPEPVQRALAAALAAGTLGDTSARPLLLSAVAATDDDGVGPLVSQLAALGALDGAVLAAAAGTPDRCLLLASLLRSAAPDLANLLEERATAFGGKAGKPLLAAQVEPAPARS